MSSRC